MKILVVLPLYGGSLPIGQYCAKALEEMGHIVEIFQASAFYSAHTALRDLRISPERLSEVENAFLNTLSQAIFAKAEFFKPDLVFAMAQAPLNAQTLRRLQKAGIATAMWFVEDYRLFPYWRGFAPLYDFFFVIQKEPLLELLAAAGVSHAAYMPLAALPSFHKKATLTEEEKNTFGAPASFMGAGYPNRRAAFKQIKAPGLKLWGTEWPDHTEDPALARLVQQNGARVSAEDSVKIYSATATNINLHSSVEPHILISQGDFVNPRTFELACMGVFQLVDKRTLMPELFRIPEPGTPLNEALLHADAYELIPFESLPELQFLLDFFPRHPEIAQGLATRAQARVYAEHTYQHRMAFMLNHIAAHRENWPPSAQLSANNSNSLQNLPLPEETKRHITTLLNDNNLPPDADFKDVVAKIRQASGVLSPTETLILFIDEWRTQYGKKA